MATNGTTTPHPPPPPPTQPEDIISPSYALSTLAIHADDKANTTTDVAPALRPSTTFRYTSDPTHLVPAYDEDVPPRAPDDPAPQDEFVYSRLAAPTGNRLELVLGGVLGAPCLTYSSGLSAFHALLVWLKPRVVAIGKGYHGCHGVLKIYQKLTGCKIVDLFDESSWDAAGLGEGDVVHLETPVNPTGLAYNIQHFAEAAHKRGAHLTLDATFAPPPLQDPWKWGTDFVMHSGTKYFGGHSDMLCGVIAIGRHREGWERDYWGMVGERVFLGAVMGSLEHWLGVRSMRTYELRILRQSENCTRLVAFLDSCLQSHESGDAAENVRKVVKSLSHASLQKDEMHWLKKQMPQGYGPVFALTTHTEEQAKRLPSKLHLFHHATSLGGVESLIEWRRMSDNTVEPNVLRVSVGVESWEDLREDLVRGFGGLVGEGR